MPTEEQISACRKWLERVADVDCRAGLDDEADILDALQEILDGELDEAPPTLFDELAARVKAGLEALAREEATWGERTVNDRLDAAFADLDARGIVTAQALGSTLQEGAYLIDEQCADREGAVRGSVFYHRQDLEGGVAGEGLLLAFGGIGESDAEGEGIGREIVHVLKHHGVPVTWNGSVRSRIEIEPFVWQKRRTTQAPPGASPAPPVPPPPPPPPPCALCNGRGWIAATDPTRFPDLCVCKGGGAPAKAGTAAADTVPAPEGQTDLFARRS